MCSLCLLCALRDPYAMTKKQARQQYAKQRSNLSATDRMRWDDLILINFQSIELPFLDTVLSFYPMEEKNEINTFLLTDYLRFKNPSLQICYPKTDVSHNTMQAIATGADAAFEGNAYNILEPTTGEVMPAAEMDMVIVPLLICDATGNRVGFGKGFYDRYLKDCRADCLKIGVSYFEPIEAIEDAQAFDVPLNLCITPQKAYVF